MVFRGRVFSDSVSEEFYIELLSGDTIPIVPSDPMPELGRVIEGVVIGGRIYDWQEDPTELLDVEKRKVNILTSVGLREEPEQSSWDYAYRLSQELANELRRVTHDLYEVDTRHIAHDGASTSFHGVPWGNIEAIGRQHYPDWVPTHVSEISGVGIVNYGICGRASLGGRHSYSKSFCVATKDTHYHETIGHSILGIEHDGVAGGAEYGGFGSIMAMARTSAGISDYNTAHLYEAGLIEKNKIIELLPGQSTSTWLVHGSDHPLSLRLGENKMVLCRTTDENTRLVVVSFYNGFVQTHEPGFHGTTRFVRTGSLKQTNKPETLELPGNVTVKVHQVNGDCASVSVSNDTTTIEEPMPEPSWYSPAVTDNHPEWNPWCAGIWGNRKWSVQGLHIVFDEEGNPIINWLAWHWRNRGEQKWYWCKPVIDGPLAYGELKALNNGIEETVGYMEFYWYDESQGIMRATLDNQRYAVPVTRVFSARDHELNGFYEIENGNICISVGLNKAGEEHAAIHYMMNDEKGNSVWHEITGPLSDLSVYSIEGGQLAIKSAYETNLIGTGNIDGNVLSIYFDDGEEIYCELIEGDRT